MNARDRYIERQLAKLDQFFEDNIREFWSTQYAFAGDDGVVELGNCDSIVAALRQRQASFRRARAGSRSLDDRRRQPASRLRDLGRGLDVAVGMTTSASRGGSGHRALSRVTRRGGVHHLRAGNAPFALGNRWAPVRRANRERARGHKLGDASNAPDRLVSP